MYGNEREPDRVRRPDRGPQREHVLLGGGVLALVLRLGVDHEAVGAVGDRVRAQAGLGERVVAVDELPRAGADALACRAATSAGLNCAQRLVAPSELLTKTVVIPAERARAAIAAGSPASERLSSQIHMPLPRNASGSVPGAGAGAPPTRGGARTVIRRAFERRPARSETVTDTVPARVPGGHAGDVADARAVELRGQRAARPPERHAHALVDPAPAELKLAPDRHLDAGLAVHASSRARTGCA